MAVITEHILRVFVFDPSRSEHGGAPSINLGDLIIRRSINEVLAEVLLGADIINASSHRFLTSDLLDKAMQADLALVAGTNLLSSHILDYNQWKLSPDHSFCLNPPQLNAVLLGVGWWQYQDSPDLITQSYYKRLLHPFLPHSIRDSYTQNKLIECGIHNTINTSCPTLWNLQGVDVGHKGNNRQCLFCLTDYHQAPEDDDRFVAFLLRYYDHIIFFPQGSGDMEYAASLPAFASAGQRLTSLPHDIDVFYETVRRGGLDYIGTRLHAGAFCLSQGLPTLILNVDNRSAEIAKDINLPVASRGDEKAINRWLTGGAPTGPIALPWEAIDNWKKQVQDFGKNSSISRTPNTPAKFIRTSIIPQTEKTLLLSNKQHTSSRILLNLGCGGRWHPDWINIDFNGDNKNVFSHNLRQGVPLPDASADCIYTSHCLEHFAPHDAERFLRECARVLKPAGLLRIVVPDLEQVARAYLEQLDASRLNPDNQEAAARHAWMIVELIDQLCRHQSGGEMLRLWALPDVPAEDFIISRVGTEYLNARKHCKGMELPPPLTDPQKIGDFRLGGESHLWMYDEISLTRLLRQCGFINIRRMNAVTSAIEGFSHFHLDTNADGSAYKPDSLYMEAMR